MKAVFALALLALGFAPRACDAQQTRGQVTASVTIVEAIGVTAGASVAQASGETLDVTTPLSIRGSAPRVVQVVDDGEGARPISAQLRPSCPPADGQCPVRARVSAPEAKYGAKLLTYMVATVNE
jgi:hypothetical protein